MLVLSTISLIIAASAYHSISKEFPVFNTMIVKFNSSEYNPFQYMQQAYFNNSNITNAEIDIDDQSLKYKFADNITITSQNIIGNNIKTQIFNTDDSNIDIINSSIKTENLSQSQLNVNKAKVNNSIYAQSLYVSQRLDVYNHTNIQSGVLDTQNADINNFNVDTYSNINNSNIRNLIVNNITGSQSTEVPNLQAEIVNIIGCQTGQTNDISNIIVKSNNQANNKINDLTVTTNLIINSSYSITSTTIDNTLTGSNVHIVTQTNTGTYTSTNANIQNGSVHALKYNADNADNYIVSITNLTTKNIESSDTTYKGISLEEEIQDTTSTLKLSPLQLGQLKIDDKFESDEEFTIISDNLIINTTVKAQTAIFNQSMITENANISYINCENLNVNAENDPNSFNVTNLSATNFSTNILNSKYINISNSLKIGNINASVVDNIPVVDYDKGIYLKSGNVTSDCEHITNVCYVHGLLSQKACEQLILNSTNQTNDATTQRQ